MEEKLTKENAIVFGLYGEKIMQVERIIDGDTIECLWKDNDVKYIGKIRLEGINTPETNQIGGKEATEIVREKLPIGSQIQVKCNGLGSFGRILGVVYTPEGENLNKWLLDNNYAELYKK